MYERYLCTLRRKGTSESQFAPISTCCCDHDMDMCSRVTTWYAEQIGLAMEDGVQFDKIEVKLTLTTLKPLHAKWLMQLYDYMTSSASQEVIANGWKDSGITYALEMGLSRLPSLDPFADTDPLSISLDIQRIDYENLAGNDILFDTKDSDDEEYENDEVVEFEGNDVCKVWGDEDVMEEVAIF